MLVQLRIFQKDKFPMKIYFVNMSEGTEYEFQNRLDSSKNLGKLSFHNQTISIFLRIFFYRLSNDCASHFPTNYKKK